MNQMADILAQSALFSDLCGEPLDRFCQCLDLVRYTPGDVIFREGEPGDTMFVIGEGTVSLSKRMGHGAREIARLGPGMHFGDMALISDDPRSAQAIAATEIVAVRVGQAGFEALMSEDPRFARRLLRELTRRLSVINESTTRDVLRAHEALIFSLAKLADSRDPETGAHLYRVRDYCSVLADLLQHHPKYSSVINAAFIEAIYLVSPLHDIGKVAIPDGILLKKGKLTDAEYQIMSTHTTIGAEAIDRVLEYCDFASFQLAKRVILSHHERYDGKGYPQGLAGEGIPIEAQIMAMADIYDALISARVYKAAMSYEDVRNAIGAEAGLHFDPVMTEVMVANIGRFEEVHKKYELGTPGW